MIDNNDIDTLARATAYGPNGNKLGRVGEVYLDNETGKPAWITVVTGLFGTRRHFVPIDEAELDSTGVRVPYDKDTVTGAPNIDEDGELSPLEEEELYRYYRRGNGTTAAAPTGQSPTDAPPLAAPTASPHASGRVPAGEAVAGNYHPRDDAPPTPDDAASATGTSAAAQTPEQTGADTGADRPRGPRLVKRVVTTEYYSEDPDDDTTT